MEQTTPCIAQRRRGNVHRAGGGLVSRARSGGVDADGARPAAAVFDGLGSSLPLAVVLPVALALGVESPVLAIATLLPPPRLGRRPAALRPSSREPLRVVKMDGSGVSPAVSVGERDAFLCKTGRVQAFVSNAQPVSPRLQVCGAQQEPVVCEQHTRWEAMGGVSASLRSHFGAG